MTVVILVYSDPELETQTDSQPFSTENMYSTYWQPLAKELGLQWVPALQFGIPLDPEDLAPVIDEIRRMRPHFVAIWGDGADDYAARRIDPILKTLEKAQKNNHYVWVG